MKRHYHILQLFSQRYLMAEREHTNLPNKKKKPYRVKLAKVKVRQSL